MDTYIIQRSLCFGLSVKLLDTPIQMQIDKYVTLKLSLLIVTIFMHVIFYETRRIFFLFCFLTPVISVIIFKLNMFIVKITHTYLKVQI